MFSEVVGSVVALSDSDLCERLRANELERRSLDAEAAVLVAAIDQRGLYARVDGHRTMAAFLRAELNCSTYDASMWRSLGKAVDGLDGVGSAWFDGRFGRGQATKLAKARNNHRVHDQLGPFVPILVEQAEILDHAGFVKLVDVTVAQLDADGAHEQRDDAIEHRNAHVSAVGDGVVVSASGGDPLTAIEMEAIFEKFTDAEYAEDVQCRNEMWGDDALLHELARTPRQRRHDAIVAIFRAAAEAKDSGMTGTPAQLVLNIVVDANTWAQVSHDAGIATETNLAGRRVDPFTGIERPADLLDELMADPSTLLDRRCESDTGVPLHAHDVLRAALSGHVRRVVVDAAGTVIDMGRRSRLYTGSAREAATLLVTTCQHPGCRMPARWSQVDHNDEWVAQSGETTQANSNIECGPHNVAKSTHRWRTRRATNGHSYTMRNDGTIMLPVGARQPEFENPALEPDVVTADDIWASITDRIRVVDPIELALASGR